MRPSRPMMARVGSSRSRHQVTSVESPKVQIIAIPAPLSAWASGWALMGTSTPTRWRSEEHTSELQSRGHLVCRLLLEKQKTVSNIATHRGTGRYNHSVGERRYT